MVRTKRDILIIYKLFIYRKNVIHFQCEDEWLDVERRFEKEGIDYNRLKTEEKLIHVWRWLVDADINLQNARKMIEKLRLKQNEELEVSYITVKNVLNI